MNVTAPSSAKCQVTVGNSVDSVPASGADGMLSVEATRDCTWTASSATAWIAITSGGSGQGGGAVHYTVSANPVHSVRHGTLAVNDQQIAVTQQAAVCRYQVAVPTVELGSGGGTLLARVQTDAECDWSAASDSAWLTVVSGSRGAGEGAVTFSAQANPGAGARTASITVAQHSLTITQAAAPPPAPPDVPGPANPPEPPGNAPPPDPGAPGPPPAPLPAPPPEVCSYALSSDAQAFDDRGGKGSVSVETGPSCSWSATSEVGWIDIQVANGGTGPGEVTYKVGRNKKGPRTGTMTIAGQTYSVTQAARNH